MRLIAATPGMPFSAVTTSFVSMERQGRLRIKRKEIPMKVHMYLQNVMYANAMV